MFGTGSQVCYTVRITKEEEKTMFREMRRARQALSHEENEQILRCGTSGVLALLGDEDYPYAVPLSYVYHEGKVYFHGAMDGHKADAVRRHDKASFCVIAADDVIPSRFTTHYRSVIAFGRIRVVEEPQEIRQALLLLAEKYSPSCPWSVTIAPSTRICPIWRCWR